MKNQVLANNRIQINLDQMEALTLPCDGTRAMSTVQLQLHSDDKLKKMDGEEV